MVPCRWRCRRRARRPDALAVEGVPGEKPLSKRLLTLDDGSRLGLKLTEFNAQCNRRMRVELRELERDGRSSSSTCAATAAAYSTARSASPELMGVRSCCTSTTALANRCTRGRRRFRRFRCRCGLTRKRRPRAKCCRRVARQPPRRGARPADVWEGGYPGRVRAVNGGALIETVASYATPSGEGSTRRACRPTRKVLRERCARRHLHRRRPEVRHVRALCAAEVGRRARDKIHSTSRSRSVIYFYTLYSAPLYADASHLLEPYTIPFLLVGVFFRLLLLQGVRMARAAPIISARSPARAPPRRPAETPVSAEKTHRRAATATAGHRRTYHQYDMSRRRCVLRC